MILLSILLFLMMAQGAAADPAALCTTGDACGETSAATPAFLKEWEQRWEERKSWTEETKKNFFLSHRIAFLLGLCCFIGCLLYWDSKRTKEDGTEVLSFAGTCWGLRDTVDDFLKRGAEWYAQAVTDRTLSIFCTSIATVALVCCVGLPMQEWISDPIDVVTQKDSPVRVEKTLFDGYFQPSPRITQVIMRPPKEYAVSHQYGHKNYGSIFQNIVLQNAMRLTKRLIDLEVEGVDPVTGEKVDLRLADVCYKLVDDHCFVTSPFSYFQNNITLLDCINAGGCFPERDEAVRQMSRLGKTKQTGPGHRQHLFPEGEFVTDITKKKKAGKDDGKRKKRSHRIDLPINSAHPSHHVRQGQDLHMSLGLTQLKHIFDCIKAPVGSSSFKPNEVECGSQMGGAPVPANLVFGGWYKHAPANLSDVQKTVHFSDAYILTIALDTRKKSMAEIWETGAIKMLKKYTSPYLNISFMIAGCIEDEIEAATSQYLPIFVQGYVLVVVYLAFAIPQHSVDSRKSLKRALASTLFNQLLPGIFVPITIAFSLAFVTAVFGIIGVPLTLMSLEVQPFLLFAIGVNNTFHFARTYNGNMKEWKPADVPRSAENVPQSAENSDQERLLAARSSLPSTSSETGVSSEERGPTNGPTEGKEMEQVLHRDVLTATCRTVLPSMLCTTFAEFLCFLSMGLSSAHVLCVFAYYASLGVLVNFFLTLTIFVPVFVFAMRHSPADSVPKPKNETRGTTRSQVEKGRSRVTEKHLLKFLLTKTAKYLFTKTGRLFSIALQCCMIAAAVEFISYLKVGLDEKMSVPKSSYVHKYLSIVPDTLATSMPVRFVVHSKSGRPLDVGDERFAKLFCTARADCDDESLGNLIGHAVRVTQGDLISQPAFNWFDDYRKFRSLLNETSCCLRNEETAQYCTLQEVNATGGLEKSNCTTCLSEYDDPFAAMTRDLNHFTSLLPTVECPMSGRLEYRGAINMTAAGEVHAFYLTSFHRAFRNSSDYVEGLRLARDICTQFKTVLDRHGYPDVDCFPYADYYIVYDQYLSIATTTAVLIVLSTCVTFCALTIASLLPRTAIIVAANTLSSTIMLVPFMVFMGMELNALTMVNLAMSLGIGLDISARVCLEFANSGRADHIGRATDALVNVGSTLIPGTFTTKLIGLIVMYSVESQIYTMYYFKFYIGLLSIVAMHALVFIPVMLTFFGPGAYKKRYVGRTVESANKPNDDASAEPSPSTLPNQP